MKSFTITDTKSFMAELFSKDTFDSYEFVEASIKMGISYEIDGHINKEFYDTEQRAALPEMARWKNGRPQVFHMIKGQHLPRSMKIILKLPVRIQDSLLEQLPGILTADDLEGCYLNIYYEPNTLTCTTGISYRSFILDKSFDQLFDQYIEKQLTAYM